MKLFTTEWCNFLIVTKQEDLKMIKKKNYFLEF